MILNRVIRPISYNSNTKSSGGEMSANGVRYNVVTSITDANTDTRDSKGDMSLDGSRGNVVTSIDSRSNNNTSDEEISIDGERQNVIASVDSIFVDGNSYNVVSSLDSISNNNEAERGNVYTEGVRHNAITSIGSGSSSEDGNRYDGITSIGSTRNINKSRISQCRNNQHHNDNKMSVKLSTGWYNGGRRCLMKVRINWKWKTVIANGYRVPCKSNVVIAWPAVWKALVVPKMKYRKLKITWFDA